ncbi:MAG: Rossmann-like and DUF2520 domain-containing protein [Pseudomonadota bacterium]|nr:Rossmann-like and DUF2520 domain-containing protein [Pseudomonadota bacterium]
MMETLAFIGLGRVGGALAVLLSRAGFPVAAICDRERGKAEAVAGQLDVSTLLTTDAVQAARAATVVFLTVQDRYIGPLCEQLAAAGAISNDQLVAHVSGSLTSEVLQPATEQGAGVFSLHPLQSIADPAAGLRVLPGSYFCFEGDESAYPLAGRLVAALEGRRLRIAAVDKPLYHAAAVVASNFFMALEFLAISMLEQIGVGEEDAREMLLPLIRGSLENLALKGPVDALTGPIVRGDHQTIAGHLQVLEQKMPTQVEMYKSLARLNVELAARKSGVSLADFPVLE